MNIIIHRGAEEIGGNCIELEANGKSILLDLGMPLSGDIFGRDALPKVNGLTDGSNPDLLAIVISHPHADHYGLVSFAHPSIPVYIGAEADKMLRTAIPFSSFGAEFPITKHYSHRKTFQIGEFLITPYLADHSAFDAYSFLIEANGKRIFYSGDLRGHGWKAKAFENLIKNPPNNIDAMLLEGTTLGRNEEHPATTEAELVPQIVNAVNETSGIILAAFSGQNIDRLVTFYKAALSTKRTFVADMYIANLLLAIGRKTLPNPTSGAMRIFLPQRMKSKIIRDKSFDLIAPFYENRIYQDELKEQKNNIIMSFRSSMIADLEKADCLQNGRLIYSMWSGYIERSDPNLRNWCFQHNMNFDIIHTSGHASRMDLLKLVAAIKPKCLVPIHTIAHSEYEQFGYPIMLSNNGNRLSI